MTGPADPGDAFTRLGYATATAVALDLAKILATSQGGRARPADVTQSIARAIDGLTVIKDALDAVAGPSEGLPAGVPGKPAGPAGAGTVPPSAWHVVRRRPDFAWMCEYLIQVIGCRDHLPGPDRLDFGWSKLSQIAMRFDQATAAALAAHYARFPDPFVRFEHEVRAEPAEGPLP